MGPNYIKQTTIKRFVTTKIIQLFNKVPTSLFKSVMCGPVPRTKAANQLKGEKMSVNAALNHHVYLRLSTWYNHATEVIRGKDIH